MWRKLEIFAILRCSCSIISHKLDAPVRKLVLERLCKIKYFCEENSSKVHSFSEVLNMAVCNFLKLSTAAKWNCGP